MNIIIPILVIAFGFGLALLLTRIIRWDTDKQLKQFEQFLKNNGDMNE